MARPLSATAVLVLALTTNTNGGESINLKADVNFQKPRVVGQSQDASSPSPSLSSSGPNDNDSRKSGVSIRYRIPHRGNADFDPMVSRRSGEWTRPSVYCEPLHYDGGRDGDS